MKSICNRILIAGILFFSCPVLWGEAVTFKQRGAKIAQFSLDELKKKLPVIDVPILEQHNDENRTYRGFHFQKLLSSIYKDAWMTAEEIVFTCVDGYQPSISVAKLKAHDAYLVFENKGGKFKIDNKFEKKTEIDLGPYYLVWENVKNSAVRSEGVGDWPYQITTVDIIRLIDKFPNIVPPSSSSDAVKRGFQVFQNLCIKCHSINAEGGTMGQDLNYPVNVTEYWNEKWLEKWILDPRQIRYNATMPSLEMVSKDRTKKVKDVVAYLKVMAKNKRAPLQKSIQTPPISPNVQKLTPITKLSSAP